MLLGVLFGVLFGGMHIEKSTSFRLSDDPTDRVRVVGEGRHPITTPNSCARLA